MVLVDPVVPAALVRLGLVLPAAREVLVVLAEVRVDLLVDKSALFSRNSTKTKTACLTSTNGSSRGNG